MEIPIQSVKAKKCFSVPGNIMLPCITGSVSSTTLWVLASRGSGKIISSCGAAVKVDVMDRSCFSRLCYICTLHKVEIR